MLSPMKTKLLLAAMLLFGTSVTLLAQASKDARFEIQRTVNADQAAARIAMPFGKDGFELGDDGVVDKRISQLIQKNGKAVEPGRVVTITEVAFGDRSIEIELDGGGKNKDAWYDHIQVGMGSGTRPVNASTKDDVSKAKGTKIVLRFAKKVPADITPSQLRDYLRPVLDFDRQNVPKTAIETLPPEFQAAVKAKEVLIGMDRSTVMMSMGQANQKFWDNDDSGNPQETWMFRGRGLRTTFVWFQGDVVVKTKTFMPETPEPPKKP